MRLWTLTLTLALGVALPAAAAAQAATPTTREMNLISWQEFSEFVPGRIETVLLPTGTLEPHGVLPNGSDNLAPEAMAGALAERLDALVAPTLNYGVTGSLAAYPGAFRISPESYAPFVDDILSGLARNGFRNIIVLNGHGGEQTALLQRAAQEASERHQVRTLVINWWSLASAETFAVFGENGGHAGNNETAYVQAVVPEHVHPERYAGADMTTPYPAGTEWAAFPFPSSIGLYEPGQGEPTFDPDQAMDYFTRVNERVASLIEDVIRKWDMARLNR
jgi:creatinine amidohydrolase